MITKNNFHNLLKTLGFTANSQQPTANSQQDCILKSLMVMN